MKKGILGILTALLALSMIFTITGCPTDGGDDDSGPTKYTVKFEANGGTSVGNQSVVKGGKVTRPPDPTKANNTFGGWYKESALTTPWNFTTDTVSGNITLYAKWTTTAASINVSITGDATIVQDGTADVTKQYSASVTGTSTTTVTWTVAGAGGTGAAPTEVTINATGLVTVAKEISIAQGGTKFTVVATSTVDSTAKDTKEVIIYANTSDIPTATDVTVTAAGDATTVAQGAKLQFTAVVTGSVSNFPQGVSWQVIGNSAGTSITPTGGLLTVSATETVGVTLTITATSDFKDANDTAVSGTATVTVTAAAVDTRTAITFISYYDDDNEPQGVEVIYLEDEELGQKLEDLDLDVPDYEQKPGEWQWAGWVDADGEAVTKTKAFFQSETIVGKWWSTTLTDTGDALEKTRLENGSYALYEFELPAGKEIGDIKEITVSYKVSQATIKTKTVRNVRLMGPYIYKDFISNIAPGDNPHYGDFAYDPNGTPTARYIAGVPGSPTPEDAYNKNGPYINWTKGNSWNADWSVVFGTEPPANEWFEFTYPFTKTFFTNTTVVHVNKNFNVPVATTRDRTVYFGIGLTSTEGNNIVSLVKDVKLVFDDNSDVEGALPELPVPGKNEPSNQVFASFWDPIQYNWRGPAEEEAVRPTAPTEGTADWFKIDISDVDLGEYDDVTGDGWFYANLSDWKAPKVDNPSGNLPGDQVTGTFTGSITNGELQVKFDANGTRQRLVVGFLPVHVTKLRTALEAQGDVKILINGTAISGGTTNFRYCLASPFEGGNWQGTALIGGATNAAIEDLLGVESTGAFHANATDADTGKPHNVDYFILQRMEAVDTEIKITSIKISYNAAPPKPPEDCDCTNDGDCIPFVGNGHTCNATPPEIVCKCTGAAYGAPANFADYAGIKQSGSAAQGKFLVLNNGGLLIYARTADYSCIDIDTADAVITGLTDATSYTLTVTGKAIAATDLKAQFTQNSGDYNELKGEAITGTAGDEVDFSITHELTGAEIKAGVRIRVYISSTVLPPFIFNTIKLQAGSAAAVMDIEF